MTTHELLGTECMSFADWYAQYPPRAYTFPRVDRVHSFLTQPLTPEWVEKYVEGFEEDWLGNLCLAIEDDVRVVFSGDWYIDGYFIKQKTVR